MATVKIQSNILENKVDTFTVDSGITIEKIIREHTDGHSYDGSMVECYDLETGKTYFAAIESDTATTNAIVEVNGKDASLDYEVKETDVIGIVITPAGNNGGNWDWGGAIIGSLGMSLSWGLMGFSLGGWVGFAIGAIAGGIVGLIAGGIVGAQLKAKNNEVDTSSKGIDSQNLPDVRGATNQPLLDQSYPFVLGKHLVTPFIIGSPWNEISGYRGDTNYIHVLYAVGYAPLRLTDFKLGDMFLAHNQRWGGNENLKNIFHGSLHGIDSATTSTSDTGDIVSTWKNNDVTIEILQQDQNGGLIDYGTTYPYARIQEDVRANVLYIADGTLEEIDRANNISYKGLGLKNGLRNCPIHFTEQFPKSATVELDFANGLYKTRSETADSKSSQKYYKIPLWVAIQWRVYSDDNAKADGESSGVLPLPNWNGQSYDTTQRGWISFDTINGQVPSTIFTLANRNADIDAHTGNKLVKEVTDPESGEKTKQYTDINEGWIGAKVFNLQALGGSDEDKGGINEFRCVTSIDFVQWARDNLLTDEERASADDSYLINKMRAYFFDNSNSAKSIEVRVVRISPCYIDEVESTKEHSAFKFNDIFTWTTLSSEVLDGDLLMKGAAVIQKRPLTAERMRKLCVVSLKAKTDNVDQLSNTIKSFSCIAQSFAPIYDDSQKKWVPERVNKITKYYKPSYRDQYDPKVWHPGEEISEQQFYEDRQNGIKSIKAPAGNDFVPQIVNGVIRVYSHIDDRGRYFIPYNDRTGGAFNPGCDGTMDYCVNGVASMFLLAGIGPQLGVDALGYEQRFYQSGQLKTEFGDFNMTALAKWNEETKALKDGSYYSSAGYHYNEKGERVYHNAGDLVEIFFAANAYIYQSEVLENMLSKIAIAGRAVYTRDNKGRLTVIMDKKEKYPVALINQQNTLKSSYSISFEELPSGMQLTFADENDGYMQNNFYCMVDGEDADNPRGAIEQYGFPYVTNPAQQNSLGRYLLANRILNREVVTKKLGIEGASIGLGNLVKVSDDTMLIGTDTGGRITKLLESESLIYGFIINNTYHYTGEEEEYQGQTRCKEGVVVMQPSQYKESRIITIRLAKKNTRRIIDGVTYQMKKGNTNTVLFDVPIAKVDNSIDGNDTYVYKPEVDNLVSFGIVGEATAIYRVIKIKGDAKRTFEFTLMKYQDDLYEYGRDLPSFQNNMTIPDRSGEDAFALSENVTQAELIKAMSEASELAQGRIDDTFGGAAPVPADLTAAVKEDCIQFTCNVDGRGVNTVDHIVYEITKYRLNNGVLEELVTTIEGSYSTEYYYDRTWEGYPEKKASGVTENDGSLDFWKFRAKSVSIYTDENNERIESAWTEYVYPTALSLSEYGTWIPPVPTSISFVAVQEGINANWGCDLTNVYGNVQYVVMPYYLDTMRPNQTVVTKSATYQFDRALDGYPEKEPPVGSGIVYPEGTLLVDNFGVVIKAVNVQSGKFSISNRVAADVSLYKTWIPSNPVISSRVSNRNVTLYLTVDEGCYGVVNYLIGVRRFDDLVDTFYVPDLEINPYSSETAYKKQSAGLFITGHIESSSQFTQTMPLKAQSGIVSALKDKYSTSDPDAEAILTVPVGVRGNNKILILTRGGFAPTDTTYEFEVYAFNKTVENYYDNASVTPVDHDYDITTYHKVSDAHPSKFVTALATSVQDILNGSIISDKIGRGAITETKIEDDAITTPKLSANAVVADKIYAYNLLTLTQGAHTISGYAYDAESDVTMRNLLDMIRKQEEGAQKQALIDQLDNEIKAKSLNYWLGLDTAHPEFYMGNVVVGQKNTEEANYFHYYFEDNDANLDIKLSNFIVTAISSTIKGYFNVRNKKGNVKYVGANSFLRVNPEATADVDETIIDGYYNESNDTFYSDSQKTQPIAPDTLTVYKDKTDSEHPKYYQFNGTSYYEVALTGAEEMILKGDFTISTKNSNGSYGMFKAPGTSELGILRVSSTSTFNGSATFNDSLTLNANGSVTSGHTLTINANATLSVSGTLTVGETLSADSSSLTIGKNQSGHHKNAAIYGGLSVSDASSFGSTLGVSGVLTASGGISTNSLSAISGTFVSIPYISSTEVQGAVIHANSNGRCIIPTQRPSVIQNGDIWLE